MITPLELLQEGRQLITDPQHWIRNTYAENKDGIAVEPNHHSACKFCSLGAIRHVLYKRVTPELIFLASVDYEARLALESVMGSVSRYNDNRSHSDVLCAWDQAIKHLTDKQENA